MGLLSTPPHLFICGAAFLHPEANSGNFLLAEQEDGGRACSAGCLQWHPCTPLGGDRVNDLVFGQQLPPQLPPPLVRVRCAPDRWSGASSTIQSGLNREINTQEL